jgi:hypothetical protein
MMKIIAFVVLVTDDDGEMLVVLDSLFMIAEFKCAMSRKFVG